MAEKADFAKAGTENSNKHAIPDESKGNPSYDLICLGELLIDFTVSTDIIVKNRLKTDSEIYVANPGGAPGNVACAASKYGLNTAFIGAVGNDHFAETLLNTFEDLKVESKYVQKLEHAFTTLAFVSLDKSGDREFSFARKPGADTLLELNATDKEALKNTKILHIGTISLTDEPSRTATKAAADIVHSTGGLVSFDPNLRKDLWDCRDSFLEQFNWGLNNCDILKISSEDLAEITDLEAEEFFAATFAKTKIKLILYSVGAKGAYAVYPGKAADENKLETLQAETDPRIKAKDTTGAGDIFTGAFLSKLIPLLSDISVQNSSSDSAALSMQKSLQIFMQDPQGLAEALLFANRIAGLSTTKSGGIPSIPELDEYAEFFQSAADADDSAHEQDSGDSLSAKDAKASKTYTDSGIPGLNISKEELEAMTGAACGPDGIC